MSRGKEGAHHSVSKERKFCISGQVLKSTGLNRRESESEREQVAAFFRSLGEGWCRHQDIFSNKMMWKPVTSLCSYLQLATDAAILPQVSEPVVVSLSATADPQHSTAVKWIACVSPPHKTFIEILEYIFMCLSRKSIDQFFLCVSSSPFKWSVVWSNSDRNNKDQQEKNEFLGLNIFRLPEAIICKFFQIQLEDDII